MLPKSNEERVNVSVADPPAFPDMVQYLHKRASMLLKSGNCFTTAAGKLPFAPSILTEALVFLRLCLEESAGVSEEQRLSGTTLAPVSHYLTHIVAPSPPVPGNTCVDKYYELLLMSLDPAGGTEYIDTLNVFSYFTDFFSDLELHSVAVVGLLQLTVACPNPIASLLLPRLTWIRVCGTASAYTLLFFNHWCACAALITVFVCLSVCLSVCLFVWLSVCLSVSPFFLPPHATREKINTKTGLVLHWLHL